MLKGYDRLKAGLEEIDKKNKSFGRPQPRKQTMVEHLRNAVSEQLNRNPRKKATPELLELSKLLSDENFLKEHLYNRGINKFYDTSPRAAALLLKGASRLGPLPEHRFGSDLSRIQLYDKAMQAFRPSSITSYGGQISGFDRSLRARQAFERGDDLISLIGGYKTSSLMSLLIDHKNTDLPVPADRHVFNFARIVPIINAPTMYRQFYVDPDLYGMMNEMVKEVAHIMGVTPGEAQSMIWHTQRELYPPSVKASADFKRVQRNIDLSRLSSEQLRRQAVDQLSDRGRKRYDP